MSENLRKAIRRGWVAVDQAAKTATIVGYKVSTLERLSDDAWLDLIEKATRWGKELEVLGYQVTY